MSMLSESPRDAIRARVDVGTSKPRFHLSVAIPQNTRPLNLAAIFRTVAVSALIFRSARSMARPTSSLFHGPASTNQFPDDHGCATPRINRVWPRACASDGRQRRAIESALGSKVGPLNPTDTWTRSTSPPTTMNPDCAGDFGGCIRLSAGIGSHLPPTNLRGAWSIGVEHFLAGFRRDLTLVIFRKPPPNDDENPQGSYLHQPPKRVTLFLRIRPPHGWNWPWSSIDSDVRIVGYQEHACRGQDRQPIHRRPESLAKCEKCARHQKQCPGETWTDCDYERQGMHPEDGYVAVREYVQIPDGQPHGTESNHGNQGDRERFLRADRKPGTLRTSRHGDPTQCPAKSLSQ